MPKLTKSSVESAKPKGDRYRFLWDSAVRGFALRVWPTGKKVYVYQYRDAQRRVQRIHLGDASSTTVEKARKLARRYASDADAALTDPTKDPARQRTAARATDAAVTVAELAAFFLTDRRKRAKPATVAEYERLLNRDVLPTLGASPVNTISRGTIEALLATMENRPATANNCLAILGAMFTYALDHELRADGRNPCARIRRYPLTSRRTWLTQPQYTALGAALTRAEVTGLPAPPVLKNAKRGMSKARRAKVTGRKRGAYAIDRARVRLEPANPIAVAVIRFLALSGWREGEALTLRRDAIDWDRGTVRLDETKTGRSVRPLGTAALDVLRSVPTFAGNMFVFPGAKEGDHLKEVKRLWLAAKFATSVKVRLHDLRHSFATTGRELGFSDYVIAQLVGHTIDGMTGRYGDVPPETVKRAADAIATTIANRLAGKSAAVLLLAQRA